jgi:hypothetical protein
MRKGNAKTHLSPMKDAERKRLERKKMRAEGYNWFQHWVHKDDAARVKKLAARLLAARKGTEDDEG